jgi:hypothetical protein
MRNAKHAAQRLATLEARAFPVIGDLPVATIATDDVLRVLRPIWELIGGGGALVAEVRRGARFPRRARMPQCHR